VNVFGKYAQYYDLLYRDKDYDGEVRFIDELIKKNAPNANHLLELGCGTGIHAEKLAEAGYSVHGVDLSAEMLKYAEKRIQYLPVKETQRLSFSCGDIRQFRHGRRFDAVISLFHVMSYQTEDKDLTAVCDTVKQHLKPKGIFIFDCWYGPAVLTDRPVLRVKKFENQQIEMIRIAEPLMHANENIVDVNYTVWIKDKNSSKVEEIKETHRIRYWFMPEIKSLLGDSGFDLVGTGEWMTSEIPGFGTWGVYFVCQKK